MRVQLFVVRCMAWTSFRCYFIHPNTPFLFYFFYIYLLPIRVFLFVFHHVFHPVLSLSLSLHSFLSCLDTEGPCNETRRLNPDYRYLAWVSSPCHVYIYHTQPASIHIYSHTYIISAPRVPRPATPQYIYRYLYVRVDIRIVIMITVFTVDSSTP